ncbi:MAG: sodium:proline symporter, partial [Candidatus Eremiobacteraeota bacterium]|nr:sodium:proline symporter [Candidatus Eremiobacteraeota bacterium]
RRFIRRTASEAHYVWISRLMTIVAMVLAAVATLGMDSIGKAWAFIITFTAGVGLVMILRWYWWRINAWTEISALLASGVIATILQLTLPEGPNQTAIILLLTVPITTVVWLAVTFLTKPEPLETLANFYTKVQPNAFGWRPIAHATGFVSTGMNLGITIADWIAGCGLVYFALFGIGKVVLGEAGTGIALLVAAAVCGAFILWDMNRRDWESAEGQTSLSQRASAPTAAPL